MFIRLASAAALLLLAVFGAVAQDGLPLARFQFWDLHVLNGGRVCVVASRPTDAQPTNVIRGEILFMISSWPGDGIRNQPYAQMGYPLATEVSVTIDGETTFAMTEIDVAQAREGAWLQSAVEEELLLAAMRGGREMVVRARSTRGTNTVDIYSLLGISAALDRAAQECR